MSSDASSSRRPLPPRYIDNNHVELLRSIGSGAYGEVYLAVDARPDPTDPQYRAVKCLRRFGLDKRQRHFQRREIGLHCLASNHPGIIRMDRLVEEGDYTYVIMDFGDEGDLFSMITDKQRYVGDDELIRDVFLQLLDGVHHLHSLGIAHRDVKPENIVCSDNGTRVRLCDFGLATSEAHSTEFGCGSTFYIAPEGLGDWFPKSATYATRPGDVWSLGIILVNLVCGRNPWRIASPQDESFNSFLADPRFLKRILPISDDCLYILSRIFTLNPEERVTLPELRELICAIGTFHLTEDECRLAHANAQQTQTVSRTQSEDLGNTLDVILDEEMSWPTHTHGTEEDGVFHFDDDRAVSVDEDDNETPSLRTDSGSPSPENLHSRSGSSTGGSMPPTPLLGVEGADARLLQVHGGRAVWEALNKGRLAADVVSPDVLSAGSTSPFFA